MDRSIKVEMEILIHPPNKTGYQDSLIAHILPKYVDRPRTLSVWTWTGDVEYDVEFVGTCEVPRRPEEELTRELVSSTAPIEGSTAWSSSYCR